MSILLTYLDPQPPKGALPPRLASPFAGGQPHPLALRAAAEVQQALRQGTHFAADAFKGMHRGKMFGVLVVADAGGRVGYLKAFSGTMLDLWEVDGFVGPTFDLAARTSMWPVGRAALDKLGAEISVLDDKLQSSPQAQRSELATVRHALKKRQIALSNELLGQFFDGYRFTNAHCEVRSLYELFAPHTPPGGAGDCAAPKLFRHAQQNGLRPIALAEFWWGTSSAADEGRHEGSYYPACQKKCGPILSHMLQGWAVDAAPEKGGETISVVEPQTVFEDAWLAIVNKPVGLLSVSGRSGLERDSVQARLRERYPQCNIQIVIHQLSEGASGLVLATKESSAHASLQKQFFLGQLHNRHIACLEGIVNGNEGIVSLPLRPDPQNRPRHVFDPIHGSLAVTEWKVLSRHTDYTRVALVARTSRTHQLRVHAADPNGLAAPIVGDRIYGHAAGQLVLHSQDLSFVHPASGKRMEFRLPAPF